VLAPGANADPAPVSPPAPAKALAAGEFQMVPIQHIFGSEELSMAAPAVAQRAPKPYVGLGPDNGFAVDGQAIWLRIGDLLTEQIVRIVPGLSPGLLGWPVGLPGMPRIVLPAVAKVEQA
jgi:NADH-quinone oxidoreductase subunit G